MPVSTNDIACFTKETLNYIYLFNGDRYPLEFDTWEEVEEVLDPQQFYRANRQFIINAEAIKTIRPQENPSSPST